MRRSGTTIENLLGGLALLLGGCIATPLPTPPTAEPALITIVEAAQPGAVDVHGEPGAIGGQPLSLRVTSESESREVPVAIDGSFDLTDLASASPPTLYLEGITDTEDIFLVAITRAATPAAVVTDPGPDRDMDGSPDAIDCAPDDPMGVGQRCPPVDADGDGVSPPADCDDTEASVFPGAPEICNALDDNCDGRIDEGCVPCRVDADCAAGQSCTRGVCGP